MLSLARGRSASWYLHCTVVIRRTAPLLSPFVPASMPQASRASFPHPGMQASCRMNPKATGGRGRWIRPPGPTLRRVLCNR